jgi:hypothetical protein
MALAFSGCKDDEDNVKLSGRFFGDEINLGNGKAKAWIELDDLGNPTSIGVTLTEKALENLPDHDGDHLPVSYTLNLPKEKSKTTFNHIDLDWNAHGHEPENIYDKPHFDFHFYMISEQDKKAIGVNDPKSEEFPEGKYLPATYVPVPGSVPQMGKHWVDPYSGEFQEGGTFTNTFIYGSYNKQVTFYEPMITKDFLLTKPNASFQILQPAAFQKTGYYPGKYSVVYDPAKKEYHISLVNLSNKLN